MYNPAPMKNPSFDLVIFDCDGVLVESEPLACQVYVQMFREFGYPLDYAETLYEFHGFTLLNRLGLRNSSSELPGETCHHQRAAPRRIPAGAARQPGPANGELLHGDVPQRTGREDSF